MARALYAASQAGLPIDMIIRGACTLRPQRPGVSERIRVRSIVGRFLEHSRVYYFENGGQPELYVGSADLMERNLDRRVETLCRVSGGDIAQHLRHVVLDLYLRDNQSAYELVDAVYRWVKPQPGEELVDAQQALVDWYTSAPARIGDGDGLITS
jgi:polyphosphate kinase